ncbi:MAG TPA: hypothetical protein VGG33_12900 [Polyangia bacterium]
MPTGSVSPAASVSSTDVLELLSRYLPQGVATAVEDNGLYVVSWAPKIDPTAVFTVQSHQSFDDALHRLLETCAEYVSLKLSFDPAGSSAKGDT